MFAGIGSTLAATAAGKFIGAYAIWFKIGAIVVALLAVWAWDASRLRAARNAGKAEVQVLLDTANADITKIKGEKATCDGSLTAERAAHQFCLGENEAAEERGKIALDAAAAAGKVIAQNLTARMDRIAKQKPECAAMRNMDLDAVCGP